MVGSGGQRAAAPRGSRSRRRRVGTRGTSPRRCSSAAAGSAMLQWARIGAPGNSGQISRTLSQSVMTRSNRLRAKRVSDFVGRTGDVDTALSHDPHRVRVQRLGVAAGAACLDRARRSVFDEGFGDLGAGAVAGAQEQQSRSSPSAAATSSEWRGRREREPGMEREPGFAEQVPAAEQVGPVVDVATVGRASAGADDAGLPELRQVVRDQVLRLARRAARARRHGDRCDRARRPAASAADR